MEINTHEYADIIKFAEGRMTYDEFEMLTYTNSDIWYLLQSMISVDMKEDMNHPIWSDRSVRMVLEANNFSVRSSVEAFGIESELGRLRLYSIVSRLVSYYFTEVVLREPPEQSNADILEQLKLDYITGCDVDAFIEEIILGVPTDMTKKERKSIIKNTLKEVFHIEGNKRPLWAQEPEWPMGKNSPMAYVSRKRDGELVLFTFRDVDTGEERIVEQLY